MENSTLMGFQLVNLLGRVNSWKQHI
uniref:Uncharacterized protein n=1 Tax=Lepeophtheirus salmonis TaxID=72036 RepID=A0A0K2UZR6_LEPSM